MNQNINILFGGPSFSIGNLMKTLGGCSTGVMNVIPECVYKEDVMVSAPLPIIPGWRLWKRN